MPSAHVAKTVQDALLCQDAIRCDQVLDKGWICRTRCNWCSLSLRSGRNWLEGYQGGTHHERAPRHRISHEVEDKKNGDREQFQEKDSELLSVPNSRKPRDSKAARSPLRGGVFPLTTA